MKKYLVAGMLVAGEEKNERKEKERMKKKENTGYRIKYGMTLRQAQGRRKRMNRNKEIATFAYGEFAMTDEERNDRKTDGTVRRSPTVKMKGK